MTDVPPPESPRPPRGRPRREKDVVEEAILSDEEVARRVDVRGGGTPRGPVERAPVRDRRVPPVRRERTGARDSLLLIGLVVVGLVAVRLFLPDGPLTASATATPGGTQAAVATPTPAAPATAGPSGGLITLPPTEFVPTASPGPVTEPPITPVPTPTPTLRPGQTPVPTPKPTKTPTPTATVQPSGTPTPPGTATVIVKMHVVNDDGGDADASDWTMKITGEAGSAASPNNFAGSESGTAVTIPSGKAYLVTDNIAVSGYGSPSPSADCSRLNGSGGLAPGQTVTCTITRTDLRARVNVTIVYSGATPADEPTLTVAGANASPTSVSGEGLTPVGLDSNASWSVEHTSGASGYGVDSSGTCSSSGLNEGQTVSCTFTFTEPPPPAPEQAPVAGLPLLPFLLPRRWIPRRWRSTRAG